MTNHIPTLATCQRLKSAGFPQTPKFYWIPLEDVKEASYFAESGDFVLLCTELINFTHFKEGDRSCAAPLLTEILEQLPADTGLFKTPHNYGATSPWVRQNGYRDAWTEVRNNPAEAAALLWLKLKERE